MIKPIAIALALALAGSTALAQQEAMEKPYMSAAQTVTLSAQIVDLDKENRLVTLKGPQGNERTIKLGDEVKRLDEFEVGDIVIADYMQEMTIEVVAGEGAEPGAGAMAAAARAPETESPAGLIAQTSVDMAKVVEIDIENNTFKLDWGDGDVEQYVARDPENLKRAEVGDMVIVTFTEALALQLQQAPQE